MVDPPLGVRMKNSFWLKIARCGFGLAPDFCAPANFDVPDSDFYIPRPEHLLLRSKIDFWGVGPGGMREAIE